MRFKVIIETADRGTFQVRVNADTPSQAENIACEAVRYQFSHSITEAHAVPIKRLPQRLPAF